MVPFACLVNHSPWPHVVRYGKLNTETSMLDFPAFRPCQEGDQVYISYGPVPNLKLITYYGFAIEGNPHDIVPLTLTVPAMKHARAQRVEGILEQLGIGLEHNLRSGPLATKLIACMRIIASTDDELQAVENSSTNPLRGPISEENEIHAKSILKNALVSLLQTINASIANFDEKSKLIPSGWQLSASFCDVYLKNQRSILQTSLQHCK